MYGIASMTCPAQQDPPALSLALTQFPLGLRLGNQPKQLNLSRDILQLYDEIPPIQGSVSLGRNDLFCRV